MGIIAAGQITVVDLSDAPVLSAFITASKPTTQVYDQTAASYNPSYASSAQTLTLNLTKQGQQQAFLAVLVKSAGLLLMVRLKQKSHQLLTQIINICQALTTKT